MNAYAVIMAGGPGERLWPLSTPEKPKQFLRLFGDRTMIQHTAERVISLTGRERVLVIASNQHVPLVREQLSWVPAENIIAEPIGRNTAPCVAVSAAVLKERDPDASMIVLPADHLIHNEERFRDYLRLAVDIATQGTHLVTLGIEPTYPATGYGYIQRGEEWNSETSGDVSHVRRFVEKPDAETAARYTASGDFFWNSGMFVWHVDVILEELATHMSGLHAAVQALRAHVDRDGFREALLKTYQGLEKQSIDRGVLEKSSRTLLIPTSDIGWNDIGSWESLRSELEHVDKPWGHEHVWALNQNYVGKFLHIRAGESLSLQYHESKDETICIVEGRMLLRIGPSAEQLEDRTLNPGDFAPIPPGTVHQMVALENTCVAEVSTPQIADVVRLSDRYGRAET